MDLRGILFGVNDSTFPLCLYGVVAAKVEIRGGGNELKDMLVWMGSRAPSLSSDVVSHYCHF